MVNRQTEFNELLDFEEFLTEMLAKGSRNCDLSYWQGDKQIIYRAPRTAVAGQMLYWVRHRLQTLALTDPTIIRDAIGTAELSQSHIRKAPAANRCVNDVMEAAGQPAEDGQR